LHVRGAVDLKIAVCGCGWSGSLLSVKLPEYGSVDVYEQDKKPKIVCGCGIPISTLRALASNFNLNAEDYVLWKTRTFVANIEGQVVNVTLSNLCTFDKERFMQDIIAQSAATFHFGEKLVIQHTSEYDLVVDASGKRALLGRLSTDDVLSCFQARARFKELPHDGFYCEFSDINTGGYLWMFPLSEKEANVGCSAYNGAYSFQEVQKYLKRHDAQVLEEGAKSSRLNPPHESLPFYAGNVVGVGESVGAITRLGEGNELSAKCVELFLRNFGKPKQYVKEVFKELGWLKDDHALHKAMRDNKKLKMLYHALKVQRIYRERFQINENAARVFAFLTVLRKSVLFTLGL
jgi:flavin-dependent dehydrogenase